MNKVVSFLWFFTLANGLFAISKKQVDRIHSQVYDLLEKSLDSASSLTDLALQASIELGYEWGEGNSLFLKGYIARERNELSQSIVYYLKAINVLDGLDDEKAVSARIKLLTNCGAILEDHKKFDEAIDYYGQAIELAGQNNLGKRLLVAYYNRASAYFEQGNYQQAGNDASIALEFSKSQSDEFRTLYCFNLLGLIYMNVDQFSLAREYFKKIIDYPFVNVETPSVYMGRAYHNLANSYVREQNNNLAEQYYLLAIEQKQIARDSEDLFISYMDLAELYEKSGSLSDSKDYAVLAYQLYEDIPLNSDYYKIFDILRKISFRARDYELANNYAVTYQLENEKFLQEQRKVLEFKEQFTIDLVIAGFQQEVASNQKISYLNHWIFGLLVISVLVLLAIKLRGHWVRAVIAREINQIENSSVV